MATIDRIEPAYTPWSASTSGFTTSALAAASDDEYEGKHRRPALRVFSLLRMFYTARHRRR